MVDFIPNCNVSAVFKPIILPVKIKNSLIPASLQKQRTWVHLTCLSRKMASCWCGLMHYILPLGWSTLWAVSASLAWESLKHEWSSLYPLGDLRTILAWGSMGQLQSSVKTILATESWKGLWKAFEEKLSRRCILPCSGSLLCWDSCRPWEN